MVIRTFFGEFFIPRCVPVNCPHTRPPNTCEEVKCGPEESCAIVHFDGNSQARLICIAYGIP